MKIDFTCIYLSLLWTYLGRVEESFQIAILAYFADLLNDGVTIQFAAMQTIRKYFDPKLGDA